jgi:hypothetical protein
MIKNLNGLDSFAVVFVYVMVLNVRTCDIFYIKKCYKFTMVRNNVSWFSVNLKISRSTSKLVFCNYYMKHLQQQHFVYELVNAYI